MAVVDQRTSWRGSAADDDGGVGAAGGAARGSLCGSASSSGRQTRSVSMAHGVGVGGHTAHHGVPELTLDQRLRALAAQGQAGTTHEGAGGASEREAVDWGDSDSEDAAPTAASVADDQQADDYETTAAFL